MDGLKRFRISHFFSTAVLTLGVIGLTVYFSCVPSRAAYRIDKSATGQSAMVVSAHPLATDIGVDVLRRGGNAVDAAVAVHFALAVTYPVAGNIGGGGFMLMRSADGETVALDFRETAPQDATRDMFLDSSGHVVKRKSLDGHLAAGVPGSVAGLEAAHARYGSMPFRDLVTPAVQLARKGLPLTTRMAKRLNKYAPRILSYNQGITPFTRSDRPWQAGDILWQPDLANTLHRIALHGSEDFYRGKTADLIVAEMRRGDGIVSAADLKSYAPRWRDPLIISYKGYQLISMPPPSSGGVALGQLVTIVEGHPLAEWGVRDIRTIHLMAEAERRVFADRAQHLGDSDFYEVPLDMLLDKEYLEQRMAGFSMDTATASKAVAAEGYIFYDSPQTTHFTVVDPAGNTVALTTTLNRAYGCKVVVDGAGFFLNNEMDDFSVKPGVPNSFGLVGNEANAIAPRKRMLSSMTPTIVTEDDQLLMTIGSPGGSKIITSVFQVFLNIVEFGMTPEKAVAYKRFHHQWLPEEIIAERDCFSPGTMDSLRMLGHRVKLVDDYSAVEVILRRGDGSLKGAADPRGDDHAKGL